MSNLEQLLALGAECVGGSILWKHKVLGVLRDGDFQITDEGRKALQVVDVEVKMVDEKPTRRRPIRTTTVDEPVKPATDADELTIDLN